MKKLASDQSTAGSEKDPSFIGFMSLKATSFKPNLPLRLKIICAKKWGTT